MTHYQKGKGEPASTLVLSPSGVRPFSGHFSTQEMFKFGVRNLDLTLRLDITIIRNNLKEFRIFLLPWYRCIGWFTHRCLLEKG
jgi:hypothetical protein